MSAGEIYVNSDFSVFWHSSKYICNISTPANRDYISERGNT